MVNVVIETRGAPARDVSVSAVGHISVGDLVHQLGAAARGCVTVDGRVVPLGTPLYEAGLLAGSIVRIGLDDPLAATASVAAPLCELRVVGGPDAGHRFALAAGEFVVGRLGSGGVDIGLGGDTVSARHAALRVDASGCRVRDLGARNGVRVDGSFVVGETLLESGAVLELGAVQLVVVPHQQPPTFTPAVASARGLVAFDRPPRTLASVEATTVRAPAEPRSDGHAPRMPWASVLAPLVIAGILLAFMPGNSMFIGFMALSPVLALASWAEDRRRARKRETRARHAYEAELAAFDDAITTERAAQLTRLRAERPDLGELTRRASGPAPELWERRPAHADFGELRLGLADITWTPRLEPVGQLPADAAAVVAAAALLARAPVGCSVRGGRIVGIVGPRDAAVSLARSLTLQAVALHGPADLALAVFTEPDRAPDWEWTKWLPHVRTGGGGRLIAATVADRDPLATQLVDVAPSIKSQRLHLLVMDATGVTAGRNCAPRELLDGSTALPVSAIVLAERRDQLPGRCTDVIEVRDADGVGDYVETVTGRTVRGVHFAGASTQTCRAVALSLARFDDPDLVEGGAGLPSVVPFADVAPRPSLTADALASRWAERRTGELRAPIGVAATGPVVLDLVRDGPHALIAGTTGSGKSELLRTVVASFAAAHSPRDVNFVLIDYKGGSAFAECADLPHTVGLVTDLDERLGIRALTCLDAELRHRERLFRTAGAADLGEYISAGEPGGSLPRLVVAVDEFATMAAELPDFVDALVGVAQRGRSLGVHLLLATQRPRGAVNDNIRANSNVRIALRTHDSADSADVLDAPDAAAINRASPGRGYLRLGPGELVPFQSAYASGSSLSALPEANVLTTADFVFGPGPAAAQATSGEAFAAAASTVMTDLAAIVCAARNAAAQLWLPAPRQPWPDPLPANFSLAELPETVAPEAGWGAPIGLADDPAHQRRVPYVWRSDDGNLLVYGNPGSGTSTTLATVAVSLASRYGADELHVYVLDFGTQLLAPLAALPHVGAVIGPADRERQERLIRRLRTELTARQESLRLAGSAGVTEHNAHCAESARLPAIVLLLDNWSAFAAAYDDLAGLAVRDELLRIIADGPGLGVYTVISADRANAVPAAAAGLIRQRLVCRLADPHDYAAFGISPRKLPQFVPGRAIDAASGREVQLALPADDGVAAAVARVPSRRVEQSRLPARISTLPVDVSITELAAGSVCDGEWWLPFGIGDRSLERVGLRLRDGDHALVAGGPRAGKSTLLLVLAAIAAEATASMRTIVIAGSRSPLRELADAAVFDATEEEAAVAAACADESPCLLLVDDAERVDDTSGALRRHLARPRAGDRVVAAGRADALRSSYGHWTQELRRSRQGIVLKPNADVDGDLWGMLLPRRGPVHFSPGRGYLVLDGDAELVQVARP